MSHSHDDEEDLYVELSPPVWPLNRVLLLVAIGIWASGEVVAVRLIVDSDVSAQGAFTTLVAVLWTCAGLLALYALAWNIAGREIIRADGRSLTISRCVARWCRVRTYPFSEIARTRVEAEEGGWLGAYWWMHGIKARMVAFDHGSSTVRFGDRIEEQEAEDLVRAIETLRTRAAQ